MFWLLLRVCMIERHSNEMIGATEKNYENHQYTKCVKEEKTRNL